MPRSTSPAAAAGLPASTRKKIEVAIDRLIDALDLLDADPDMEDENEHGEIFHGGTVDDEPSLGASHSINQAKAWDVAGADLEFDGETGASADAEPSLGAPEWLGSHLNVDQKRWAKGASNDTEEACEDEGANDSDQNLGSVAVHEEESQERWAGGVGEDLEEDGELEEVDEA